MAHVMLPGRVPRDASGENTRYAADAIDQMIRIITAQGANLCDLGVCQVGAGGLRLFRRCYSRYENIDI